MSEQHNEEITAAEEAAAELAGRATELRRTGWVEPPDQSCLFIVSSALDQDEWRQREEAKREAIRRRHLESKARALEILFRRRDKPDRVVYKIYVNERRASRNRQQYLRQPQQ